MSSVVLTDPKKCSQSLWTGEKGPFTGRREGEAGYGGSHGGGVDNTNKQGDDQPDSCVLLLLLRAAASAAGDSVEGNLL